MTNTSMLLLSLCILISVMVVGTYAGYITSDILDKPLPIEEPEGPEPEHWYQTAWWSFIPDFLESVDDIASWSYASASFMFALATFSVDGIPPVMSLVIFLPLSYMIFYVSVRLVRGGG